MNHDAVLAADEVSHLGGNDKDTESEPHLSRHKALHAPYKTTYVENR